MPRAQEVDEVSPGIFVWQAYDSKIRADLSSTALVTDAGAYFVDPIPLASDGLLIHHALRNVAGVVVTNINHARAAAELAEAFTIPVYLHDALRGDPPLSHATWVQDREMFAPGLTAVAIDGGPAGEMAVHYNDNGGTMIVGDALINFEPHGFGLLPVKYCLDPKRMRQSLEKLLDYAFERMLFAHGTPILSGARSRVEQVMAGVR